MGWNRTKNVLKTGYILILNDSFWTSLVYFNVSKLRYEDDWFEHTSFARKLQLKFK